MDPSLSTVLLTRSSGGKNIHRELTRGRAVRVCPGSYVELDRWLSSPPWVRYELAMAALNELLHPLFCCSSALVLLGVPTFGVPELITTVASGGRHGVQAQRFVAPDVNGKPPPLPPRHFRHRHLGARETTVGPFRVLVPAQAAAHVLLKQGLPQALTVADAASRDGTKSVADIAAWIRQWPQAGVKERALARLEAARAGAQSPAESGSRAVLLAAGFPEPELQYRFFDSLGHVADVDMAWPGLRLIGEVDGEVKYKDPAMTGGRSPLEVLRAEKARENRLLALGWTLRRWGWPEISHPERLVRLLHGAGLRAGSGHSLR